MCRNPAHKNESAVFPQPLVYLLSRSCMTVCGLKMSDFNFILLLYWQRSTPGLSPSPGYRHSQSSPLPPRNNRPKSPQQQPVRANIAKPVSRPKRIIGQPTPTVSDITTELLQEDQVQAKPKQKPRFTESTLRYRTKKISDIKSHKIESPFISLF